MPATCAYRRDEAAMPGSRKEAQCREEGVEFQFNVPHISLVMKMDA